MMDRGRAFRAALGSALLAAGALASSISVLAELMLVFGGALLAASLSGSTPVVRGGWTPPAGQPGTPSWPVSETVSAVSELAGQPAKRSWQGIGWAAAAFTLVAAAATAFIYPMLTRLTPPTAQATQKPAGTANVSGGHAIAPHHDPQLHKVVLGQKFVLSRAAITAGAAQMCRHGDTVEVIVPAKLQPLERGVTIREPYYRLLDARGNPHEATRIAALDQRRGVAGHAAPPPSVYRQSMHFVIPAAGAKGAVRLEAELPSGNGAVYRVKVADGRRALRQGVSSSACSGARSRVQ
jgi:hypothetical protein